MSLLRGRRLAKMDGQAAAFTASVLQDKPLLEPVIKINQAHMVSLAADGVISASEAAKVLTSLEAAPSDLVFDVSLEDVHMNVELFVLKTAGEAGGYLNLGKSRNDQVSTALRMVTRLEILRMTDAIVSTAGSFLDVAAKNIEVPMPGYTHLQIGQPTTVAHYLMCYAEALIRDGQRLVDCYKRVNLSPMGSAAFSGSTVSINRERVASLLGFDGLVENSMDGVSSRDFVIEFLACALMTQLDLSRFAEDQIFYGSQEASYISPPDELSSTSSIMPQKKNAVVSEIVRAKAGPVLGALTACATILKGLPQSYNLDLQEMNSYVWTSSGSVVDSLELLSKVVRRTKYDVARLSKGAESGFSVAAELAELLSISFGIPFRTAHHIVGSVAAKLPSVYTFRDIKDLLLRETRAQGFKVDASRLPDSYDPLFSVKSRKTIGSPNPLQAKNTLSHLRNELSVLSEWVRERSSELDRSASLLSKEMGKITKEVKR